MYTKRIFVLLSVIALTAAASVAQAGSPRYDFASVSYQTINDPSGSGFNSDHAYGVSASYDLNGGLLLGGSYAHESANFSVLNVNGSASADIYEAGLGYRIPLSDNVDIIPNLAYVSASSSASASGYSASQTDTGYDAGIMLRAMVSETVEVDASFDHTTPSVSSNTIGVGVLFDVARNAAIGIGYGDNRSEGQDTTAWSATFRYYFN